MAQLSQPDARRDSLPRAPSAAATRTDADIVPALASLAKLARPANDVGVRAGFFSQLAVQDWFLAAYFTLLSLAVMFGSGSNQAECMKSVGFDAALFTTGVVLTRGGILKRGSFVSGLVYRLSIFVSFQLSYFQLRHILPQVSSRVLDADILAFDLHVFGYEPAIAWDRYVNPQKSEWFAFFYFGYFFLLVAHVIPVMLADRDSKRVAHFALGAFMVFAFGHIGYMLVPGYGPYRHLAGHFEHPIEGGLFWRLVLTTVEAGGAQKDIFPSLHTAAPTFFAIFSFMHRRSLPFRYTWPIVGFCATQIIGATMFLRWHWLIDVCAGLTLATTAAFASRAIVRWEWKRRARLGLPPIFQALSWPKSEEKVTVTDEPTSSC